MPGENSRVEIQTVDRVAAFSAAFSRLYSSFDFEATLRPDAASRAYEELDAIVGARLEAGDPNGEFLLRLMIDKSSGEFAIPSIPDWMGVRFSYELEEDGTLGLAPQSFSSGHETEDTPPESAPVLTIAWQDFNWTVGYSLILNEGEPSLPNRN